MTDEAPPLQGIQVRDCHACKRRGKLRNGRTCPNCRGHRVIVTRYGEYVDLDPPKRGQGRPPDPGEIG